MLAPQSRWQPLVAGSSAAASMALLYVVLLWSIGGPRHPLEQFLTWWYFIIPIVGGFGLQVGLWRQLVLQHRRAGPGAAVAGGSGGVAMLACCAHHAADVLPLLGFTALATLLGRYQAAFFALALLSNAVGIIWMLRRLRASVPLTPRPMPYASAVKPLVVGLGAGAMFILAVTAVNRAVPAPTATATPPLAAAPTPAPNSAGSPVAALTRTDEQADVTVSVTPRSIDAAGVRFDVKLDTHSVDFDVDFATASSLTADGRPIGPATWSGGSSGHHLQGELAFPAFPPDTDQLVLTIRGVGGVVRTFTWSSGSRS